MTARRDEVFVDMLMFEKNRLLGIAATIANKIQLIDELINIELHKDKEETDEQVRSN